MSWIARPHSGFGMRRPARDRVRRGRRRAVRASVTERCPCQSAARGDLGVAEHEQLGVGGIDPGPGDCYVVAVAVLKCDEIPRYYSGWRGEGEDPGRLSRHQDRVIDGDLAFEIRSALRAVGWVGHALAVELVQQPHEFVVGASW